MAVRFAYKVNNKSLTYGGEFALGLTQIMSIPLKLNIQESVVVNRKYKESYKMYAPPTYIESARVQKEEQSALLLIDMLKRFPPEF